MYIVHRVNSLLQLRGFYLCKIPFTQYICLVLFLHLRINKSSDYAILSKNLLCSSSEHFTSGPASRTKRRPAWGEAHGEHPQSANTPSWQHIQGCDCNIFCQKMFVHITVANCDIFCHKIFVFLCCDELQYFLPQNVCPYYCSQLRYFLPQKTLWPNIYCDQLRYFLPQNVCLYYCSQCKIFCHKNLAEDLVILRVEFSEPKYALPFSRANNDQAELNRISGL